MDIGLALWDAAEGFPNRTLTLMNQRYMHGEEPTDTVAAAMLKADVIFRATKVSLSHSIARMKANEAGARCCNCCDYTIEMLKGGGLYTDFEANRKYVDQIAKGFDGGDKVEITSALGTNYTASIKGHKVFAQYGMSHECGTTSSPPDIECATGAMPYCGLSVKMGIASQPLKACKSL
jgi:leucyl aminopeptidase (aminopeptidase T)